MLTPLKPFDFGVKQAFYDYFTKIKFRAQPLFLRIILKGKIRNLQKFDAI
jgi:hypothetical protein